MSAAVLPSPLAGEGSGGEGSARERLGPSDPSSVGFADTFSARGEGFDDPSFT